MDLYIIVIMGHEGRDNFNYVFRYVADSEDQALGRAMQTVRERQPRLTIDKWESEQVPHDELRYICQRVLNVG